MKLKKIELNGFKSFGEKTEINFNYDLNGIVGPNGSGKSNIIDSIKWVLGQQRSSELRTKTNTDIIFSGSENKKAKNVAEVTLYFDNSDKYLDVDYTEVSFKRRLFRNGDNEYYINGTKCRLKDINSLILDKGFGKDSFSIISQGKVEEIIMAKAIKRREIIDEVAGVQKYREKKNKTSLKLDRLNQNIEKIEFIIQEIDHIIKPLEEASLKAIKYKEIKKDLEEKEKQLIANKIFNYSQQLEEAKEKYKIIKEDLDKINEKIELEEKEIKNLDNTISDLQQKINELNSNINLLNNDKIKKENQINLIQEKNKLYSGDKETKREEVLGKEIKDLTSDKEEINSQLSQNIPKRDHLFNEANKQTEEYKVLKNKIYNLMGKEENLSSNVNSEKYPYSVKKILDQNFPGIYGTIKDNINILMGYEYSINTILGNKKNEIITKDEEVIKQCIAYLKENKLSKVTFIPYDKVIPRSIDNKTMEFLKTNKNMYLGIALDFVKFETKYKKAISTLLGNIIICKDIDQANKLNDSLERKYQIVTLDGNIIMPNGKITGGYDKQNSKNNQIEQLNTVKQQLKDLKNEANNMEIKLEQTSTKYKEIKIEVDLQLKKQEELNHLLKEKNAEYNSILNSNNEENSNLLINFQKELEQITENINELNLTKEKLQNDLNNNINEKENKNDILTNNRADYKMLVNQESEYNIKNIRLKEKIEEQMLYLGETYNVSYQKVLNESTRLSNIEEYEEQVKNLKKQIKELGFVNLESIKIYEEEKERLKYYEENLLDLNNSKQKIEDVIKKLDDFVVVKFEEAFNKLNSEFEIIFKQLFDGGNATLILTEPDDLLNTGVEIIAQPPGKKSQVIGLLSGGEKALTAISLLFAILKIRVVPFAILDEVEAALDEANVNRYIEYLKIFSQNTQFLVITHRQATMEKLDKLYGVTMVEKGISSIIDIDFKNEDNPHEFINQ